MRFSFLFYLVLNFIGLLIAAWLFDGVFMTGYAWAALAAFLLTILHIVVRPVLILFTMPLTFISMGLFLLVINGLLFWLAGSMLEGYQVHGFGSALGGALVVSILGMLANGLAGANASPRGRKVFTFYSRPQQRGSANTANEGRPSVNDQDSVVDLEVDESGQWKIKN